MNKTEARTEIFHCLTFSLDHLAKLTEGLSPDDRLIKTGSMIFVTLERSRTRLLDPKLDPLTHYGALLELAAVSIMAAEAIMTAGFIQRKHTSEREGVD